MTIKKNRYESNEIILTVDKNNEGVNYVQNQDAIASAYGATMVITGMVAQEQTVPDMTIKLTKGVAEDNDVENFLLSEEFPAITIAPADLTQSRRDVIEMRRLIVEITPESRNFKDPVTKAISSAIIETEEQYVTEIKVLTGTPGGVAVGVEPNWIKIAEILVPASSSSVVNANIFNVDAEAEGLENTDWTNDITSIFRSGSVSDIKSNIVEIWKTGVPEWKEFRKYNAFTSYVQDEGMIWQSQIGSNLDQQPSLNQDKWFPVSAPTIKVAVADTEAIPITYNHITAVVDATTGDPDLLTMPVGLFEGQEIHIIVSGSGLCEIPTGNGVYSGGWFITENTGGLHAKWTNGAWVAVNEVTADYDDGSFNITRTSLGKMKQDGKIATRTTNAIFGEIYVSQNDIVNLPVSYANTDYIITPRATTLTGVTWPAGQATLPAKTVSIFGVRLGGGAIDSSAILSMTTEGDY